MNTRTDFTVAVIGASDRRDRFSFKAVKLLADAGHTVLPVSPKSISLPPFRVYPSVRDLPTGVHTVTLYINPARLEAIVDEILALKPVRVIFNPGTEHAELQRTLAEAGIEVVEACTLVMLATGEFAG